MRELLSRAFSELGIEYFGVLDYALCVETGAGIIERESMTPRSVIVYLLPYYAGECVNISAYAAASDYHAAIRDINAEVASRLSERVPEARIVGYGDHSPIDERRAALSLGLGVLGDNGLIINEKYGSYVFIGDIVTDLEPRLLGASEPLPIARCEGCGACRAACPTGVLRGEGAGCLSEITQRKGELSPSEQALMREYNTAWGCDECQRVCPHNAHPLQTPVEFFRRDRIEELTDEVLESLDGRALRARAFGWRGRTVLQRNLRILKEKP